MLAAMDIDESRIDDDAVLALLLLGLHEGQRAWKSFGWDRSISYMRKA